MHVFITLGPNVELKSTKVSLVSYSCDAFRIRPLGEVKVMCKVNKHKSLINFVVLDVNYQLPLLGLPGCVNLKLINRLASISKESNAGFDLLASVMSI